jgi:hypothetical protein
LIKLSGQPEVNTFIGHWDTNNNIIIQFGDENAPGPLFDLTMDKLDALDLYHMLESMLFKGVIDRTGHTPS